MLGRFLPESPGHAKKQALKSWWMSDAWHRMQEDVVVNQFLADLLQHFDVLPGPDEQNIEREVSSGLEALGYSLRYPLGGKT